MWILGVYGCCDSPYNDIYKEAGALQGEKVLFEREKGNYALYQAMAAQNEIIDRMNPTSEAKAKKNPVEVENEKKAHIKDGIAVTRFMYWLKHQIGKETITEMSASEKLEGFRKEQEGYIEPSFNTISAYGPQCGHVPLFRYRGKQCSFRCKKLLSGGFRRPVL